MNKTLSRNSVEPDWETENEILITARQWLNNDVIVASSAKSLMRI